MLDRAIALRRRFSPSHLAMLLLLLLLLVMVVVVVVVPSCLPAH